ncbi:MAG: hypothetical protein AAB091_01925 [Elusimicrobiota bacterium]
MDQLPSRSWRVAAIAGLGLTQFFALPDLRADDQASQVQAGLESEFDGAKAAKPSRKKTAVAVPAASSERPEPEKEPEPSTQKRTGEKQLNESGASKQVLPRWPPIVHVKLSDYQVEESLIFPMTTGFSLGTRAGLISAQSFLGGSDLPFGTLLPSPYGTLSSKFKHQGKGIDVMTLVTGGYLYLNTEPSLPNVRTKVSGPAWLKGGKDDNGLVAEGLVAGSFYSDVISPWRVGGRAALAAFGGGGVFGMGNFSDAYTWQGMLDANAGVALAVKVADSEMLRYWVQGEAAMGQADSYRNITEKGVPNWAFFYEGISMGADYSRYLGPSQHIRAWSQVAARMPYTDFMIGADYAKDAIVVSPSVMARVSHSPWFANEQGGALKIGLRPLDKLGVDLTGSLAARSDIDGRALSENYSIQAGLSWTPGDGVNIKTSRYLARQVYDTPDPKLIQALDKSYENIDQEFIDGFKEAVKASPDLPSFARNLNVASLRDILYAASLMTGFQDVVNYNSNEFSVPNAQSDDEIYGRWRAAYMDLLADPESRGDPMLVCIGSAQSASGLVMALSRKLGLDLQAGPVSVVKRGSEIGLTTAHAAAIIRSPEEGFFFVDFGDIMPTGTFDPDAALAIYQAKRGSVSVSHYFGDVSRGGRTEARKISEQGKIVLDAVSFYGDPELPRSREREMYNRDPRSSEITRDRALESLRKTLMPQEEAE